MKVGEKWKQNTGLDDDNEININNKIYCNVSGVGSNINDGNIFEIINICFEPLLNDDMISLFCLTIKPLGHLKVSRKCLLNNFIKI